MNEVNKLLVGIYVSFLRELLCTGLQLGSVGVDFVQLRSFLLSQCIVSVLIRHK